MEFGKLENISEVNWNLPSDDARNEWRLSHLANSQIIIGAPGWACKLWLGKIYPAKTAPEKFLYHYSRYFNCIELNASHYRIPNEETTKHWLEQVPDSFQFCPKLHKDISHSKTGLTDKKLMQTWFFFLEHLGANLAPSFIQFHENFSYHDKFFLFKFLENWPSEFKLSVELRHPSWFKQNTILPALSDYLRKRDIGLVITDVAGRRDVLHTSLTTNWSMIRLIGNNLDESDNRRLSDWAERIKTWQGKGIEKTYLFLHQPDDVWTIEFAQMMQLVFSERGFDELPQFDLEKPRDLFTINYN
jgi:uncharacterized protein YecE (DUF72 family)